MSGLASQVLRVSSHVSVAKSNIRDCMSCGNRLKFIPGGTLGLFRFFDAVAFGLPVMPFLRCDGFFFHKKKISGPSHYRFLA